MSETARAAPIIVATSSISSPPPGLSKKGGKAAYSTFLISEFRMNSMCGVLMAAAMSGTILVVLALLTPAKDGRRARCAVCV